MNKIFGTLGITIMAAATAVYFLNSWPATFINQWQLKINGGDKYFPALTIFLTALPSLLVLFVIKLAVTRLRKK